MTTRASALLLLALLAACATSEGTEEPSPALPPARQALLAGFVFSEPEPAASPCSLPATTQDLRTACGEFGGALSSSEDGNGYTLRCVAANAVLTLAPHARVGHFDVSADDCESSFDFSVNAVSGPVF